MVFYGQQILKAQTQMRAAFSDINKDCRATLYVGISRFRANAFFPLIWKLYHPSHPNISIELVSEKLLCCFSETLLETYYPDRWQDMMEEMKDGVDLLQLKELPFITTRPGNRLRQNLDQFLAPVSFRKQPAGIMLPDFPEWGRPQHPLPHDLLPAPL